MNAPAALALAKVFRFPEFLELKTLFVEFAQRLDGATAGACPDTLRIFSGAPCNLGTAVADESEFLAHQIPGVSGSELAAGKRTIIVPPMPAAPPGAKIG